MGFRKLLSRFNGESSSLDQHIIDGSSASPDTGPPKILSKVSPATGTEEEQPEGASSNSSASITEAKPDTEPLPEPQEIWEEAYHQVKNDESLASIVDEFEATILSKLQSLNADHDGHNGATSTSLIGQIANLDPNSRQNLMKRLVNNDDDRPNRSKTVSQISIVFESTKKTINSVLDVYPPASMAWAGVCVVLTPVSGLASRILLGRILK